MADNASQDTICALASGPPPAALCVIRLSGPQTCAIAKSCLKEGCPDAGESRLSTMIAADGAIIDKCVTTFFANPKSYTGEDVVEFSVHGGAYIVRRALERLTELGARLAEPGEFTRRAFESGKLDLTQAEAVADLIDAESAAQHHNAMAQLGGSLSGIYESWHKKLAKTLASMEIYIDFPDEGDVGDEVTEPALEAIAALKTEFQITLDESDGAERVRDGFLVAIMGPPNAGKSSLLNAIAGRDAAIVTEIAGTTRDFVEVRKVIGPYLVLFSDTAGLRETDDIVEAEGIRRTRARGREADLRIWLSPSGDETDFDGVEASDQDILITSKIDLGQPQNVSRETFRLSTKTGEGLKELLGEIENRLVGLAKPQVSPGLTQLRHRRAIESALQHLNSAERALRNGIGFELAAEDMRLSARSIESLTGHLDVEHVLDSIFSDFCIGK
jgi:tRNA modification GTPase